MPTFFLTVAIVVLAAVLLPLYRVVMGPVVLDRVIGLNVTGTKTITVILLTGFLFDRVEFFIDIAFVYALINFIGVLALSKYLERRGVDRPRATK